jgi:hypothetical protein
MSEFDEATCGGCGKDLTEDNAVPIREDDTGLLMWVCDTCAGQLEGVTLL